ncbi:hypothetical protein PENTCL1PPCAC_13962, partial [Pristionchus entomophagus]
RLFLFVVFLVSAVHIEASNGNVIEEGYPPRELTTEEKNQLIAHSREWGVKLERYILGQSTEPTAPVMPCFCHNCKGGIVSTEQ